MPPDSQSNRPERCARGKWTAWPTNVDSHELGLLRWELEAGRGNLLANVVAITDDAGRLLGFHAGRHCGSRHEVALTRAVAEHLRTFMAMRDCMRQLDEIDSGRQDTVRRAA